MYVIVALLPTNSMHSVKPNISINVCASGSSGAGACYGPYKGCLRIIIQWMDFLQNKYKIGGLK